ncbi:MAG: non-canonical purine NTP pyrophosphatase [Deltaproteobacteria bacterium]|nr:non-canonical purine NTP pyrophosphatase [Deltaproteobacteria bacterium]
MRVTGPVTLATRNAGKLVELQALCPGELELRLLPSQPAPPEVDEDQDSYLGNARKKACAIAAFTGGAALADDSGLEVDALPGELGVRSARYGGPGLDDAGRCARLLDTMRGVRARAARFRCVLVLADGEQWVSAEGTLEGEITDAPRGGAGFGYDPVFLLPERGCTLAELAAAEKNALSHRAAAMRALVAQLRGDHALKIPR